MASVVAAVGQQTSATHSSALKPKNTKHFTAGFVSGMTSAVLLQPLDLLKTRVQQSRGTSLRYTISQVADISSLWRGTIPSALRTSIGSALYFTTLNYTRTKIAAAGYANNDMGSGRDRARASSKLPQLSMHANLLSGSFVRGVVGFATMPITVLKVRYESSLYQYKSIMEAFRHIFSQHGIRGFFSGFGVTFARDAPYAGLYVLFYEKAKDVANGVFKVQKTDSGSVALINSGSAMFSATMATTITGPFDTIKTRVQLDPAKYPSFIKAGKLIVQESGVVSLFDGLSLRLARKAMSAGIAWCIYEELVRRN